MKSLIPEPIRKMSKIELITFDLDDTFWDIRSTIINAENNSRKWTENRIGEKIDWGTFEDFMKIRSELVKEDSSLEYDLGMLRKKTIRLLLIIAVIFFAVPITFNLMTYYGLAMDELESTFAFFHPSNEQIATEIKIMQGSFIEQIPVRLENAIEFQTFVFLIETFWRTTSLMLLGMILYRKGVLSADKSLSYYNKMILIGFGIGLIVSLMGLNQSYDSEWSGAYVMSIGANYKIISGLFMAIGYIGLVIWCFKKGIFKKLQNRLQATGRMAFTNYIGMSIICTLIFNGHGLGLYGTLDRLQQFLIVVAIWVLILIVSPLVLKKYRFGPLEWLWRKLTYFS